MLNVVIFPELTAVHQDELEAAALDTDVVKSELEQAHHAQLEQLQAEIMALKEQLSALAVEEVAAAAQDAKEEAQKVRQNFAVACGDFFKNYYCYYLLSFF